MIEGWCAAARAAGAPDGPAVRAAGEDLLRRWREPHRHYHNEDHLSAVLSIVDEYAGVADDPDLVRLAAWCHDAVYDCHAATGRNERDSATLAGTVLTRLGVPATATVEVERLVLLTAGHRTGPVDRNGALLCDADLAILAAPAGVYDSYTLAIRREYAHVPDELFRAGRMVVLRELLALPARYRSPELAARWEAPAQANLTRELAGLAS